MTIAAAHAHGSVGPVVFLIIALVVWLIPAYFSGRIAKAKGYSFPLFLILGLIFGLIMLVIVFVMPRREAARVHPAAQA